MFWQVLLHEHMQNVCWILAWSMQRKVKIRKGTRVFFLSSGLGSFPISRQLKRYFLPSLLVFLLLVYHVHARLHSVSGGGSGPKSDDSKTAWYSCFLLFHACGCVYISGPYSVTSHKIKFHRRQVNFPLRASHHPANQKSCFAVTWPYQPIS